MTEEQFQATRKTMQQANYLRGKIAEAKGNVAKWTNIESSFHEQMREAKAEGAKACLLKAIERLGELRKQFKELQLPTE